MVDEELLAEAQRHLDGASAGEAANEALREFVHARRAERREALADLRRMAGEGLLG